MKKKVFKILMYTFVLGIYIFAGNNNVSADSSTEKTMIRVSLNGAFKITNKEGEYLKNNGKTSQVTGTIPVYNFDVTEGSPGEVVLWVKSSLSFKYESNNKNSNIRIMSTNYYANVEATNAKGITVSNNNGNTKVSITGENMSYRLGMVADNNGKVGVDLTGKKSNGTVSMEDSEDGIVVKGASGITFFVKDDLKDNKNSIKTIKFIPYASPVTISNLKKGMPKIKNAKIVKKKTYSDGRVNFHAYQQQGTTIRLSWNPIKKAKGYIIYKYNPKTKKYFKKKTLKGQYLSVWTDKNLRENTINNYKIRPYFSKGKKGKLSYYVSAITKSNTRDNVKKIVLNKAIIKGKVDKKYQMKASVKTTLGKKIYNKSIRWYSNDHKIATVTTDGKLVLKSKGKTYLWAKAHNGKNMRVDIVVK